MLVAGNFIPEYRPARKFSIISSNGWWLNRWPLLGWLETFVKIAAWFFVPYILPPHAAAPLDLATVPDPSPAFAIQTSLMFVASFGLALAVIDRLVYREVISLIFVFPNNWAHWSVTAAMYRHSPDALNLRCLRFFWCLMLAGDLIKLLFFAVHDFTRLKIARFVVYSLVAVYAFIYASIILLEYY